MSPPNIKNEYHSLESYCHLLSWFHIRKLVKAIYNYINYITSPWLRRLIMRSMKTHCHGSFRRGNPYNNYAWLWYNIGLAWQITQILTWCVILLSLQVIKDFFKPNILWIFYVYVWLCGKGINIFCLQYGQSLFPFETYIHYCLNLIISSCIWKSLILTTLQVTQILLCLWALHICLPYLPSQVSIIHVHET